MKVQNMRKKLKEVVETVPRKNKDVIALYKETFPRKSSIDIEKPTLKVVTVGNDYTYIGGGESAPAITNFMGKQVFRLGELTKVTDPDVLAKIKGNPTFRKGAVSAEEIYELNKKSQEICDKKIQQSINIQSHIERENAKAG